MNFSGKLRYFVPVNPQNQKRLEMESQIAVHGVLGPAVDVTTVDLHDGGIIRCCNVVAHVLTAK